MDRIELTQILFTCATLRDPLISADLSADRGLIEFASQWLSTVMVKPLLAFLLQNSRLPTVKHTNENRHASTV